MASLSLGGYDRVLRLGWRFLETGVPTDRRAIPRRVAASRRRAWRSCIHIRLFAFLRRPLARILVALLCRPGPPSSVDRAAVYELAGGVESQGSLNRERPVSKCQTRECVYPLGGQIDGSSEHTRRCLRQGRCWVGPGLAATWTIRISVSGAVGEILLTAREIGGWN
jgi:hypothetical protein